MIRKKAGSKNKVLILTSEFDRSIEPVVQLLNAADVSVERLNMEAFPMQYKSSYIPYGNKKQIIVDTGDKTINLHEFDTIWYRHCGLPIVDSGLKGKARAYAQTESEKFLDGMFISLEKSAFWVSKLSSIQKCSHRLYQLQKAVEIGFDIPMTIVSNDADEIIRFFKHSKKGIIGKPVGVGIPLKNKTGYRYYEVIYTKSISKEQIMESKEEIQYAPTIYQELIEKDIELRVTVVGNTVFSCAIHSQEHEDKLVKVDWRRVSPDEIVHSVYTLPKEIANSCVKIVKSLDLEYGAIDIIKSKEGKYVFLEINASGQYGWIQYLTGMDIDKRVAKLLMNHQ